MENALHVQTAKSWNKTAKQGRFMNYTLWTVQVLLALVFLFTGTMKLAMSTEMLTAVTPLPVLLVRFVAVCELLGTLGLILPALLRIQRFLTPLAACGLIIIMLGAVVSTIIIMGIAPAVMPFVLGLLLVFVVYGRRSYFTTRR